MVKDKGNTTKHIPTKNTKIPDFLYPSEWEFLHKIFTKF